MDRQSNEDVLERPVHALVAAMDDAADALQELEVRVRTGLGVNAMDNAVLRWVDRIHRRGGSTRVGDITAHFGVSSGSATEIVHRLTRAGLLRRQTHPTDARIRRLVPTETAQRRLDDLVGGVQADLDALLATLTGEEEQRLVGLLGALSDLLRADRTGAASRGPRG